VARRLIERFSNATLPDAEKLEAIRLWLNYYFVDELGKMQAEQVVRLGQLDERVERELFRRWRAEQRLVRERKRNGS
jgi:hypothetical protein